jgi:hypothetical protein
MRKAVVKNSLCIFFTISFSLPPADSKPAFYCKDLHQGQKEKAWESAAPLRHTFSLLARFRHNAKNVANKIKKIRLLLVLVSPCCF